jgi:hypothetical protein
MREWRTFGPVFDGGGWIVDEPLFRLLADFESERPSDYGSVSIVCFASEPASAGGREVSAPSLAESFTRYLRGTDAVASWDQGWLSLLLVDAETTHLPSILERLTARLETVAWSAGGSCYPRTATRAADMLRQAVDLMGRAKEKAATGSTSRPQWSRLATRRRPR